MSAPRLYGNPPKCHAHYEASGPSKWHTEGCVKCAEIRAKGIIKPLAPDDVSPKKRGRIATTEVFVDHEKAAMMKRKLRASAVIPDLRR